MKLFNYDSKVYNYLIALSNCFLLSLSFSITSMFVITFFPSLIALFEVEFKIDELTSPILSYYKYLKDNLFSNILPSILYVAILIAIKYDYVYLSQNSMITGLLIFVSIFVNTYIIFLASMRALFKSSLISHLIASLKLLFSHFGCFFIISLTYSLIATVLLLNTKIFLYSIVGIFMFIPHLIIGYLSKRLYKIYEPFLNEVNNI